MTPELNTANRVMIVDDHPAMRQALRALLEVDGNFDVVGAADGVSGALKLAAEQKPDIAIVDISLKASPTGLGITTKLKFRYPSLKVLLLSLNSPADFSRLAQDAGADGYLSKSDAAERLVEALLSVGGGYHYGFQGAS